LPAFVVNRSDLRQRLFVTLDVQYGEYGWQGPDGRGRGRGPNDDGGKGAGRGRGPLGREDGRVAGRDDGRGREHNNSSNSRGGTGGTRGDSPFLSHLLPKHFRVRPLDCRWSSFQLYLFSQMALPRSDLKAAVETFPTEVPIEAADLYRRNNRISYSLSSSRLRPRSDPKRRFLHRRRRICNRFRII